MNINGSLHVPVVFAQENKVFRFLAFITVQFNLIQGVTFVFNQASQNSSMPEVSADRDSPRSIIPLIPYLTTLNLCNQPELVLNEEASLSR